MYTHIFVCVHYTPTYTKTYRYSYLREAKSSSNRNQKLKIWVQNCLEQIQYHVANTHLFSSWFTISLKKKKKNNNKKKRYSTSLTTTTLYFHYFEGTCRPVKSRSIQISSILPSTHHIYFLLTQQVRVVFTGTHSTAQQD